GQNTYAIGSKVSLYVGSEVLTREIVPSRGFQSSVDYKAIIGLGTYKVIDSMQITWSDRSFKKVYLPAINQVHSIKQQEEIKNSIDALTVVKPITYFTQVKTNIFQKHVEDDHIDFYFERGIPRMISTEGPKAAVGDVNGDGLADVYIGGAGGKGGHLYLQNDNGFSEKTTPVFKQYVDFEDIATLFFDSDGDGDLDLFVGAGGNTASVGSRALQHRLYINDGKGNFSINTNSFPLNQDNISVATAYDFDHDGDLDLFVGARNVTQIYGNNPQSHIYINNGKGTFTDMDAAKMAGISNIGMVTNACWANIFGDAKKELILVGEWMAPHIYTFKNDHFEEVKCNLNTMSGWWQSIAATDVNGDGKLDLVLGNIGENCYLKPDSLHPIKLWVNDFNQNSSQHKIISSTIDGKDIPVLLKREMEEQVPSLKKQNLKHEVYAKKGIQELFSPTLIENALQKTFNYTSSCVAINQGNGNFIIQKLPPRMQLSSVNTLLCTDVNKDGKIDIVAGGNLSCFLPQFERLDASFGDLLINDGKGNFTWLGSNQSGILQRGDIKDIIEIPSKNGKYLLLLQNNEIPVLYKANR
ncbi:MAG: VCBS repeat-containing protein, partial [Deinococcales bacterium]|nr:VCBS repeat-containing protein [Chitinophagaceae bacterium]